MRLILALGTLAMLAALWAYAHHRPPEYAVRDGWVEAEDGMPPLFV